MCTRDTFEKKQILIVEDEPVSLGFTIPEMEVRRFRVETAETQAEAKHLLAERKYQALLLDLKIPAGRIGEPKTDPPLAENGLAIVRDLSNGVFEPEGTERSTPVFVITALGPESEFVNEARKLGVLQVFGKPVSPNLVAETIRLTLEGK